MSSHLRLRAGSSEQLAGYTATQLDHLFPADGLKSDVQRLLELVPEALEQMRPMLDAIQAFRPGEFDHFHSLQYCTYLYLLSRIASRIAAPDSTADRLFCLNRALNSIDLHHAVQLPTVFFISHGLSSVLGNAVYGERLVVFQNVTVGRVGSKRPRIGNDVVMFPGTSVTGSANIGDRCVISAGTRVHNRDVPAGSMVAMSGLELVCTPIRRDYGALYFRGRD